MTYLKGKISERFGALVFWPVCVECAHCAQCELPITAETRFRQGAGITNVQLYHEKCCEWCSACGAWGAAGDMQRLHGDRTKHICARHCYLCGALDPAEHTRYDDITVCANCTRTRRDLSTLVAN